MSRITAGAGRMGSALVLLAILAGPGSAQEDKVEGLILVPATMKAHLGQLPKDLPFARKHMDYCQAKAVVGGLDVLKKEPDARFILQLHSFTHVPARVPISRESNRLQYSVYYRPAGKAPVLLAKRTTELGLGDPKTDRTVFGTLAWKVRNDLADALAPKIIDGKAAPVFARLGSGALVQRNAFPAALAKDDRGRWEARLKIKNRLPVTVTLAGMDFVSDFYVTRKQAVESRNFWDLKKQPKVAANEATALVCRLTNDPGDVIIVNQYRYVRLVDLELSEP